MIDPKDFIRNVTVEALSQAAENYFRSISDPTPLMAKPFGSLAEAPEILQNMGLLLSGLHLAKTMTVLEFAAGTCWFSRYLNQAQCRTISCDVSETALEIGKRLFMEFPIVGTPIAPPEFLHFDGHKINLADESVDRIICHDAFHHVPNQEEALSEFARILKDGGIAGFSEPGKFHSRGSQSQYEMKNYHVLENDILVADIFDTAKRHGFTDIKLQLLCDMEVSSADYAALTAREGSEIFVNAIADNIAQSMTKKTIFFLYKGEPRFDSRGHAGLSHSITSSTHILSANVGEHLGIKVKVMNTGDATWLRENIRDIGVVKIGAHLYDESGGLLNLDFSRHRIPEDVSPQSEFEKILDIKFDFAGDFIIAIDLVSEGVCWFENVGSKPLMVKVQVT